MEAIPLTTTEEQSETREGNDSIPEPDSARTLSRRGFLRGSSRFVIALVAAGAVGGTGVWATHGENTARTEESPTQPEASATTERQPIAMESTSLYAMQHSKPETLNAPTFEGVVDSLQDALNYAVATNDTEMLKRLIPGPPHGNLLADQFMYRAAFYEMIRNNRGSTEPDPSNPNDNMFTTWGCSMEVINVETTPGTPEPNAPNARRFYATVRMQTGDQPAIVGGEQPYNPFERGAPFETKLEIARQGELGTAGSWGRAEFTDINGEPKTKGWAIISATQMAQIPPFMAQHQPKGWEGVVPPPYANYSYTPR